MVSCTLGDYVDRQQKLFAWSDDVRRCQELLRRRACRTRSEEVHSRREEFDVPVRRVESRQRSLSKDQTSGFARRVFISHPTASQPIPYDGLALSNRYRTCRMEALLAIDGTAGLGET
jgi:hypothetical protein